MNKILAKLLTCMIRDKQLRKERRKYLIEGRSRPENMKLIMEKKQYNILNKTYHNINSLMKKIIRVVVNNFNILTYLF